MGGYRLIVVDRFGNGSKWQNLVRVPVSEIVPPEEAVDWLQRHGKDVDALVHLGGVSDTTERDVSAIIDSNHRYPLKLWHACIEQNIRFIYASSAEVYGGGEAGFDDVPDVSYLQKLRPLNPNGWSKKLFDLHVTMAHAQGEAMPPQWVGLRFFNLYGPNEYHKGDQRSVLLKMYEEAKQGMPVKLFKSANPDFPHGSQQRDFIYVKDAVSVLIWALQTPEVNGIFNCGTGEAHSFAELAQALFKALDREPQVKYVDMPRVVEEQYQYRTVARMDRLREAGYEPKFFSLDRGVTDYIQTYLSKADPYL
jgi:ADP-L-glycero-D-manno-heptose 6-epimerase